MKFGVRKPSLKRSIKARTTGKIKRQVKSAVNPLYGKKGMGYINDPKKAVYNKVYNKTSVGVKDVIDTPKSKSYINGTTRYSKTSASENANQSQYTAKTHKGTGVFLIIVAVIIAFVGLFLLPIGLLFIGLGIIFFFAGKGQLRIANEKENASTDEFDESMAEPVIQSDLPQEEKTPRCDGEPLTPIVYETVLVYNNTDLMQYNIKQASIGDKVELEQEDDGVYIVMKGVLDFGYIHKRIGNKIDDLANDDYEVVDAEIIDIITEADKLNVKVRITLGGVKMN